MVFILRIFLSEIQTNNLKFFLQVVNLLTYKLKNDKIVNNGRKCRYRENFAKIIKVCFVIENNSRKILKNRSK